MKLFTTAPWIDSGSLILIVEPSATEGMFTSEGEVPATLLPPPLNTLTLSGYIFCTVSCVVSSLNKLTPDRDELFKISSSVKLVVRS